MFGPAHLLWLAVCLLLTAVVLYAQNAELRGDKCSSCIVPRLAAAAALLLHLLQCADRMRTGTYGPDTLPLHICAISTYLVVLHSFLCHGHRAFSPSSEDEAGTPASCPKLSSADVVGEILFFPGLPGALAAILFPDWTYVSPLSVLSVTGFLAHLTIALYVFAAIRADLIRPSRPLIPILFLACYAAVMIPYDKHFAMNYGFLNVPSPGSPLVFIAKIFGSGAGYYLGYAILASLLLLLCYGLFALWKKRARRI